MIDEKMEMSPIVSVMSDLTSKGYTTQFKATEKGLCSMSTNKHFKPNQDEDNDVGYLVDYKPIHGLNLAN